MAQTGGVGPPRRVPTPLGRPSFSPTPPTPTPPPSSHLKNFRDLAAAAPARIAPGRLYRGACPAGASAADVAFLMRECSVATLVDLRSPAERAADPPGCLLMPPPRPEADAEAGSPLPPHPHGGPPLLISTPILDGRAFHRALMRALPWRTAAAVVVLSALPLPPARRAGRAAALAGLNAAGLPGLYRVMLDSGGPAFGAALRAVTAGAEEEEEETGETSPPPPATLFFCRLGKDRTGLLAALILAVVGADRDAILADYAASAADPAALGLALGGLEAAGRSLSGLDAAVFASAPPAAMAAALEHLDSAYGGVEAYLSGICGFGAGWQARLRAALAAEGGGSGGSGGRARL
jgi:protein tyrosine/serine phosphatase